jgi:xylitol oxidase
VLEKELVIFAARPHWGKLFAMSPTELKSRYKRLPDFIQLSKKYDPHGKFRNAFLDRNIFSSYSRFEQRQNRKKF